MEAGTLTLDEAGAPHPRTAIRSIKVALLLSCLKPSSANHRLNAAADDAATEKEEALKREIGDLKMKVVRERLRSKRIRIYGLMELFLDISVIFVLCGFVFVIAVGDGAPSSVFPLLKNSGFTMW